MKIYPSRLEATLAGRLGFTLTELLVVISIIGLLTALLLPSVKMVMASAKGTKCMSNQRQVVIACLAYANDQEGGLPATRIQSGQYWYDLITTGYIDIPKKASTATNPFSSSVIAGCPEYVYKSAGFTNFSYGINAYLAYGDGGSGDNSAHNRWGGSSNLTLWKEFKVGAVQRQAARVYFADTDSFWTGANMGNWLSYPDLRHRNRMNVVFVDGHTAAILSTESLAAQFGLYQ
jgi:prepilin-type N-terminal cleavage/methylation domain-containing protein/prepilin-type processing-associated H-X9-DG protein